MTTMRAIDADALEKDGWMMHRIVRVDKDTMSYQTKKPTDFPTIEPERKTGKWIDDTYCSECGWVNEVEPGFIGSVKCFNFCPKCGSCNKGECDADVNI